MNTNSDHLPSASAESSPFTGFVVGRWYRDAAGRVGRCVHEMRGYGNVQFGEFDSPGFRSDGSVLCMSEHPIVAEVPAPQAQQDMTAAEYIAKRRADPAKAAAMDRARERSDPNAAMLARDKRPGQSTPGRTPFDPFKGYEVTGSDYLPWPNKFYEGAGKFASPDCLPQSHHVSPAWVLAAGGKP